MKTRAFFSFWVSLVLLPLFSFSSVAAEMTDAPATPVVVRQPPQTYENFIIPVTYSAVTGRNAGSYYFRFGVGSPSNNIEKVTLNPTGYQSSLSSIKRVRITVPPFSNQYPCVIFSKTPNPQIGDPAAVHWFPAVNATFAPYAGGGAPSFVYNSFPDTLELDTDYRYFTIWLYDAATAYANAAAGGVALPPYQASAISPTAIGYMNANVTASAVVFLSFLGN